MNAAAASRLNARQPCVHRYILTRRNTLRVLRVRIGGTIATTEMVPSNGEVEGPPKSADQAPRRRGDSACPRRATTNASRPLQALVRPHQPEKVDAGGNSKHERDPKMRCRTKGPKNLTWASPGAAEAYD